MKKAISIALIILFSLSLASGVFAASKSSSVSYDFEKGDEDFSPIFADLPASEGTESFYELKHEHTDVPVSGAGKGLLISGNNHSDDLFMAWCKQIEGLTPNQRYRFILDFKIATDVEGRMIGVGGSPGESVIVKCGVVPIEPKVEVDELSYYRLNLDKGQQMQTGTEMVNVGNLGKQMGQNTGEYEFNVYSASFDITADDSGRVWLIIGTDSGFEATSTWYLDDVVAHWTPQRELSRAEAVQLLYDYAGNGTDMGVGSFQDVDSGSPYLKAIGWAQSNGYITGYSNAVFGPDDTINIEQALLILYRLSGEPGGDPAILEWYEDGDMVSDWSKEAIAWAIMLNYIDASDGIRPQSNILLGNFDAVLRSVMNENSALSSIN